jgi:two-component system NtrC family sensor kinase
MEFTAKMATVGRLAASVAHEINNPLAIINEKAGLLRDLVDGSPDHPYREKTLKGLESISRSVDRCSGVTHRLLGFTRRMEGGFEAVALPELLQEVLGFTGKEAIHRNISIETTFADDVPHVWADRGQLQQIFLNIINNAFAAVEVGGKIELTVRLAPGGRVEAIVRDNGSGIPEEKLRDVFEPFFSTKGEFGTGLGLSITYDLVQKMGGRIEIASTLGEGTAVTVELPTTSSTGRKA